MVDQRTKSAPWQLTGTSHLPLKYQHHNSETFRQTHVLAKSQATSTKCSLGSHQHFTLTSKQLVWLRSRAMWVMAHASSLQSVQPCPFLASSTQTFSGMRLPAYQGSSMVSGKTALAGKPQLERLIAFHSMYNSTALGVRLQSHSCPEGTPLLPCASWTLLLLGWS